MPTKSTSTSTSSDDKGESSSSATRSRSGSTLGKRKQAPMTTSPSEEQRQSAPAPPSSASSLQQSGFHDSRAAQAEEDYGDEEEQKEQRPPNVMYGESKFHESDGSDNEDNDENDSAGEYKSGRQHDSDSEEEFVLDRKDLLIVKDGTIRVAESLEQQQFDANGEAIKASGTWTKAEHDRFLKAMETYPKGPWKAIAAMVGSRTVRQTQTHAQKYREKMARRMRGLRNRNGTLQYPASHASAMSGGSGGGGGSHGMYDFGAGTVMTHDRMTAVYQPASTMAGRHHPHFPHHHHQYPQHPQQQQHPHYHQQQQHAQHQHYHHAMPAMMASPMHAASSAAGAAARGMAHHHGGAVVSSSMEFNQLSKSSISSAFIGNTSYPPSWDPRHVAAAVPLVVPSLPHPPVPAPAVPAAPTAAPAAIAASLRSRSSSPETQAAPAPAPDSSASAGSSASSSASRAPGAKTPKDPDFDESMDFLMHVYSANPNQIGDTALPEDTFFKRE